MGIGLMAFFYAGCQKDIDVFEPATLTSGDIMRFFGNAQPPLKFYSWDVSEAQTIVLPGKGQAIIPAHAFEHSDGSPVSGAVEARMAEVFDKGSLIRHNMVTASGLQLLDMVVMAYLDVQQDGRALRLAEGQSISIQLADEQYDPEMRLFSAATSDGGQLEWAELPSGKSAVMPAQVLDPLSNQWKEGIEIRSYTLGWLQCARYAGNVAGKVPVCVKLPLGFSARNTAVYLALQNVNSAVAFNDFDEVLPEVCREGLPAGSKAEIIVIAEGDEEEYYFARQPIIITEHLTISVVPQKAALTDILFALDGL